MKSYSPEEIRNIALVGHQSSGKTTLGQAILYVTGSLNRLELVDDGNSCLDVLVYETEGDMDADTDNSLAIDRATVIDGRE